MDSADGMDTSTIFNPAPRIERIALAGGQACYVVDDVLLDPDRLVTWAAASHAQFRPVDFNAYPGTYLMAPAALEGALHQFFLHHMRGLFDARRLVQMHCRLGMVTLAPEALRPYQWLCHSDNFGLDRSQSIQASVLYLFRDEALGGTSFYAPTRSPQETRRLFADASALPADAFAARYGIRPGYMAGSNDYFQRIGTVPARWNRMVLYDGSLLHSGHVTAPERLTDDPRSGRLTFNGFFTCRRRTG